MIQSIPQLEAIRAEWDALAAQFQSPLLDHDWALSCAEALCPSGDLRIVTVNDGTRLVGVAPLVQESMESGRHLTLLGASKLYEPGGWLFDSDQTLAELADRVLDIGMPVLLQRIPSSSPIGAILTDQPRHRAMTVLRSAPAALGVPTTSSWDDYYAGLSSHVRSNLPRLRRKAEKDLGPVTFTQQEPGLAQVDAFLETVVAIEGSGWKGRGGSSLAKRPDLRAFFRAYCRRAAGARRLRVSTLSFGSQVAAVELSVEAYRRMWQLKIGFNDELSPYYPGLQLTEASIRRSFERGLEAYEFLGSAAQWEERWRPEVRPFVSLAVYPATARGVLGVCRDAVGAVVRRARRGLVQ